LTTDQSADLGSQRGSGAAELGEEPSREDLTAAAVSGGWWRFVSVFGGAAVQFVVMVALARLLTPGEFGTLALVMVIVGVANLLAFLGVGPAIVQRKELRRAHVETAWVLSVLGGFLGCLVVALGAPVLALVAREPSSTMVFVAVSPTLVLSGLRVVSLALLRRRMEFRRLMVIDLASYCLGYAPVAVVAALAGWGVWSLVMGLLAQGALATCGALFFGRHSLRLKVDRAALRDLLGFGSGMTASGLASYAALNGDNFIVGRVLGPFQLGLYSRAYYLMNLPLTYFAQILSQVLLPAFSRAQDDRSRFARGYIVGIYLVFLVSAPTMMLIVVSAPFLVMALFGAKWMGVVPPLQVLALFGALRATYHLGGPVAQAGGRPWSEFVRQAVYAAMVLGGSVVGAHWGTVGVAWAVGSAILVMYVSMARLAHSVAGFAWADFVAAHRAGLACGAVVLLSGLLLRRSLAGTGWPAWAILMVLVCACLGLALLLGAMLPRGWRPDGADRVVVAATRRLPQSVRARVQRIARLDT
jgi:O-antigen/teichoic acid export membrane protein